MPPFSCGRTGHELLSQAGEGSRQPGFDCTAGTAKELGYLRFRKIEKVAVGDYALIVSSQRIDRAEQLEPLFGDQSHCLG
jgi:hypothetical protein